MALKTDTELKARFETNDVPTQADYVDIFDSQVNRANTSVQTMASPLSLPGIIAVSATIGDLKCTTLTVVTAAVTDNLTFTTTGKGIIAKEGNNARLGRVVLVSGSVSVANSTITTNSRIFLTISSADTDVGTPFVESIVAGVSFKLASTDQSDGSTLDFFIVEAE